jgi:hypothetical protein
MHPCSNNSCRRATYLLVSGLLCCTAGCGGPQPERAEVQGKVTLNGAPLAGVIVTFYPVTEGIEGLPYSRGITDESGIYKLAGQDGAPGVLVGKCWIVVNWPPRERDDSKPAPPRPGPPIPVKYTVASETPFILEVKAGIGNIIDLPIAK